MERLRPYMGWLVGIALALVLIWYSNQPRALRIIPQWAPAPTVSAAPK